MSCVFLILLSSMISIEISMLLCSFLILTTMWSGFYLGSFMSNFLISDSFFFSFLYLTFLILFLCLFTMFYNFKSSHLCTLFLVTASVSSIFVFLTPNLLIFYVFFEISVIPTMFMIMGWGYQPERLKASIYLLFYTLVGSLPLLAILIYMNLILSLDFIFLSMNLNMILQNKLSTLMSIFLSLAFLIKTPMFLFHLWLPKAHVEAPVMGSMFLAGILLKLGSCGLMRISVFKFENLIFLLVLSISAISLISVGITGMKLLDMKMLIAYTSVAHMAYGLMLLTLLKPETETIALFIFLLHGVSSASMFLVAYVLYLRSNSRVLILNKTLTVISPIFSVFMFVSLMAMLGAPPSMNFFSEVLGIMMLVASGVPMIFFIVGVVFFSVFTFMFFTYVNHRKSISLTVIPLSLSTMEGMSLIFSTFLILGLPFLTY